MLTAIFDEIDTANVKFRREVLGSDEKVIEMIRKELCSTADNYFLTDEIILNPLHAGVAKKLSGSVTEYRNVRKNSRSYRNAVLYNLLGSITGALNSRAKDNRYAMYGNLNWLDISKKYFEKADKMLAMFKDVSVWRFHD